jgi:ribose transport system permease protein
MRGQGERKLQGREQSTTVVGRPMTMMRRLGLEPAGEGQQPAAATAARQHHRLLHVLSPANIGAVYVWIAVAFVFLIWSPATFGSMQTIKDVANNQAVTGLMALSLVVPLSAAVFDLSVAYTMGVTAITVAKLLADSHDIAFAVGISMLIALGIGFLNALVVVRMKIDSFIGTLATGALLESVILIISAQPIASPVLLGEFSNIANWSVGGITIPVFYVVILATILWYVLGYTATGRRIYATGYGVDAARLTGIPTARLQVGALVASALIAGFSGIVVTSSITSGSPTVGPPYLLPAFAAAFVGATILSHGRFNSWGTVIAVLLLGTGTEGLSDVSAPVWASSIFVGVTLIAAVGLTGWQRRRSLRRS